MCFPVCVLQLLNKLAEQEAAMIASNRGGPLNAYMHAHHLQQTCTFRHVLFEGVPWAAPGRSRTVCPTQTHVLRCTGRTALPLLSDAGAESWLPMDDDALNNTMDYQSEDDYDSRTNGQKPLGC